ncbi:alpha/beta hydrolase family protein [Gordonia sp. (in: high G+C Gram-positive bacteria)]|uniref:alpha/beta hydrolase n=1 Tax=Gordonia sp. (in: high G+C Gram-positive bacteria) TaxID=84139 RepID=UPI0016AD2BBD|nr:alpha/beta hydrolase family protein [Gordonia sp. (in: high G+C Gram-positive bacteria)]NLG45646.1 esterase family protein [Gordonia sp. (in: high G+C Gram-positive bacteria)]
MLKSVGKRLLVAIVATATLAGTAVAVAPEAQAAGTTETVYSQAMRKNIQVRIVSPAGNNKPTLYLLDGLRAPKSTSGWLQNTDVDDWMVARNTNVVIPFGGGGSFYTDWEQRDPVLGLNKWETFLTKELPAYMRKNHGSDNRRNGVAGLSMSGTAALNLASRHPRFYDAVASYSGYPTVTMPGFTQGIQASVAEMGGNPNNMWGFYPAGEWFANDPFLSAGNLAGKRVYVSSGTGVGSKYDSSLTPGSPNFNPTKFAQMVPLEVAASTSSQLYIARLATVPGVRLTTHITPDGAHWWDYWEDRFEESWRTTFRPAFF